MDATYSALLANFGILALCGLLVASITSSWDHRSSDVYAGQVASGLIFGGTTAILILFSTAFVSGAVFDSRAAPTVLAGIIGGPWAALITAIIGGAARLHIGGDWVINGLFSIFFYCAAGSAAAWLLPRLLKSEISPLHLAPMAAVITCAALPIFFIGQKFSAATQIIDSIFATLLLTNVVSVTALGVMLLISVRTATDRQKLMMMQAAVQHAGKAVTITDASSERRIVFANDAVSKITGYSNDELIGQSTDLLFRGEVNSDEVKSFRRKVMTGQASSGTFVNYRKDGEPFHNHVTIAPVFSSNGKITHIVAVFSDATEEVKTRSALKTVAGQIPMALIYTNLKREVEFINQAGATLFGVEFDGRETANIQTVVGEELTQAFAPWIKAALAGAEIKREQRITIKDGQQIDALLTFGPTVSDDGEHVGVIIAIEDISAYKQMEAALAQSQRLQSIGTLTGGIAHDFNNLNTVVMGNLDLLKLGGPSDEAAEFIDEALAAARRGAKLTQSLLSFGRQAMLLPDRIDLANGLTDLENLLRSSIKESTSIDFVRSDAYLSVNVDQTNLESAILNLVVNADHAIGDGPGEIRIEFRETFFNAALNDGAFAGDFEVEPMGRFAAITVTDNGPGVAQRDRDKIIEPFFTTKGRHSGAGLGLAMVHGFVRQSGGFMRIAENQPTGVVVALYLPLTEEAASDAEERVKKQEFNAPLLEAS